MYNNPYYQNIYSPQANIDRINNQIAELEKMRTQMSQQQNQTPSINQTFQLAPNGRDTMKFMNNIDEVQKEIVFGDTPFFSKDMSVVWIKNTKGEIKVYELTEIIPKDSKDFEIAYLKSQIEELKKGKRKYESDDDEYVDESDKNEKSTGIKTDRRTKKE